MEKKENCTEFQNIVNSHNIKKLYHFTDFDNLESIIKHGGLYSWADCKAKGIDIPKPAAAMFRGVWILATICKIMFV